MRTSYLRQKVSTLLVAASCLVAQAVFGALPDISINFPGCCNNDGDPNYSTPTTLLPTDVAGVVPRGNWNNVSGNSVHDAVLNDSNGTPTAVTIYFDADESWGSNAGKDTPDRKLLNGYLGISNDGHYRPLFLNNVPNGAYKLIMYNGRGDNQPQGYTVNPASVNTSLHIMPQGWAAPWDGVWIRGTSTNPDARDVCNYVQFDEIAPVNGTITIDCRSESFRGMMNGIQLIPLPAGAFRFVNQPADVTVDEGGSASFHGDAVDGTGAVTYQWLTNGVPDTSNNTPTYNRPVLNFNENGRTFALVATDSTSQSVTSRVATLTVNSVTRFVSASSRGQTNKVYASFGAAVALTGTYTLNNGATVFSAAYGATHKDIVLDTSILIPNATYTLTATGETREDNGDPTVPNPNAINFVHGYGAFCSDFATLPAGAALFNNAVTGSGYLGDDGTGTNNVIHLNDDGNNGAYGKLYITNRTLGATLNVLDARWRVRIGGDLGGHADGMTFSWANGLATDGNFIAVEEGEGNGLSFVIDTWDGGSGPDTGIDIKWQGARLPGSFLHIPRTSEGDANFLCKDVFVNASASVNSAGVAKFTYNGNTVTATIPGWTGIPNGAFVFSARTGGENDNFWVDDVCINSFTLGPVFFTLEPVETTVLEGLTATFSAAVDGSPSYYYQWYSNGVAIAGATSPTYTTPPVTEAFNGRVYSVVASNEFSSVTSSNAILHVNLSPRVVSVSSIGSDKVRILYTRNVDLGPDFGPPYYDFDNGAFEASRAYGVDHKEVIITTDAPLLLNTTYALTITDVTEEGNPGNVLLPNPTVSGFHHGYGSVCTDFAAGLPPGAAVLGTAAVTGGYLHLTDAVNSQQGNVFFPDPNGGYPVDRLLVSWKMQIGPGTCCGAGRWADGVSFNVDSSLTASSSYGEEGFGGGLTLTFDTWDNAAPDTAPSIEVRYKGATVGVRSMAGIREGDRAPETAFIYDVNGNPLSLDTSNTFANVQLSVAPDGKLDLYFKNQIIFQGLQLPSYTPFVGANFGFGARTGGANENAWVDDFCVNNFSLGAVTITDEPDDQTIFEVPPPRFTFGVAVDGLPPYSVQWYSNGVPVAGATSLYHSTPPLLRAANNSGYYAVIQNSFGSVTSRTAIAHIDLNDPTPQFAVSFNGRGDCAPACATLAPSEVAGFLPQANWNNVTNQDIFDGVTPFLVDSNGVTTPVTLTYNANDSWNNDGPSGTPDEKMFKGISKANGADHENTYVFSGLRPGFLYDVIVYLNVNGDGRIGDISCGGKTYYFTSQHSFGGTFIQAVNSNPAGPRDTGNFVRFYGVSPSGGGNQISVSFVNRGDPDGIGIAGFQVVPVPPPATIAASFTGRGDCAPACSTLASGDVAGLVPQGNWNNIFNDNVFNGVTGPLMDANGALTQVTLNYDANDSWNNDGASGTPNEKMFKGISKANGADHANTYTLSNVRPGTYDIIVYLNVNGDGRIGDISCNGTTYYFTSQHSFGGSFIQSQNTNPGGPRDVGNYVRFYGVGVNPGPGVIPISFINRGDADGIGIAGIQIVQVYGPSLLSAASQNGNPYQVVVTFSAAMNATALNPANYSLSGGVAVTGAVFDSPASNVVRLTTTAMTQDTPYTLTVSNAQDQTGLALVPNPSSKSFVFGSEFPLGGLTMRRWDGSGDMTTILNKIANCDTPQRVNRAIATMEYGTNPSLNNDGGDGNTENYGVQIAGYFVAPDTGDYVFGLASDDNSRLYISTDASPANKVQVTAQAGWGCSRNYVAPPCDVANGSTLAPLTAPIPMVAGNLYYMEVVNQEGGGGDNVSVAMQRPGFPAIANGDVGISRNFFASNRVYNGTCPPVLFQTVGPVYLTEDLSNVNVIENNVHNFRIGFDGTPAYSVQWYSNGVPVSGSTAGTNSTFTMTVRAANAGDTFYAIVNNSFSSVTSSVATLSVTLAPQLVAASSFNDPNSHIYANFSKPMGPSALNIANYSVSGGVVVSAASFNNADNSQVRLTVTAPLTAGASYTVTAQDVLDVDSNLLNPNPTARNFVHLQGIDGPAGLTMKRFDGSGDFNNLLNKIATCVAPQRFSTSIVKMEYQTSENTNPADGNTFGDGNTENYGVWIYGQFVPPTTGNYMFGLANDDVARLYLSTDASPANKVLLIDKPAWGGFRDFVLPANGNTVAPLAGPIHLVAGRTYYMEAMNAEGGGGDTLSVAVQVPGGPAIIDGTQNVIPRTMFATNYSVGCPPNTFFATLGPIAIIEQPANQTVNELFPASFYVGLDGSPNWSVQWYSNGVPVLGATSQRFTFNTLRYANGAQYHAVVANGFSSATSAVATLTVVSDEAPPVALRTYGSASFTNATLEFNEPVAPGTIVVGNFSITNSAGAPLAILGVGLRHATNVVLHTAPQAEGERYTVIMNNVTDLAGVPNPVPANYTRTFSGWVFSLGFALMETYNTGSGTTIPLLTGHPLYPFYPRERFYMTTPNSRNAYPDDSHENYGGRISGLMVPPVSANYQFSINNDDDALLRGSANDNPGGLGDIGAQACCSGTFRNTGPALGLAAGGRYAYELLWKEGGGGDYAALSADGINPIPSDYIAVYANPDAVSLVITTNLQPEYTRVVNQSPTLTVAGQVTSFDGAVRPLLFQWYSNGVAIAGATGPSHTTPPMQLANEGDVYHCLVRTPGATALSVSSTQHVSTDNIPPYLVSIRADETFTKIYLNWSELMTEGTAIEPSSYVIRDPMMNDIFVDNVTYAGSNVVLNLLSPMLENTTYHVELDFQMDLVGNGPDPVGMPEIDIDHGVVTSVTSWVISECGGVEFSLFNNLSTGDNNIRNTLLSDPRFPNNPTQVAHIAGMSSRLFYPDDSHEGYGARMRGLFIPPTSGNWIFYIRSDDSSILYMNTNGPAESGKVIVQEESGCCNSFASHATAPISLSQGQGYYIELVYKEGTGGDYAFVAARLQGQPAPTSDATDPIPGTQMGAGAAPAGIGGALNLVSQPASRTNAENTAATFTLAVSSPNGLPICYQWRRDNVDIPGANGPSYTLPSVVLADNGAVFTCVASIIGAKIVSADAVLTVVNDVDAPLALAARGVRSLDGVRVTFSEAVSAGTATEPSNYTITDSNNAPVAIIGTPTLSLDGATVTLPTGPLNEGAVYTVAISSVTDLVGNPIVSTNLTFQNWVVGLGSLFFDAYNTGGGNDVSILTGHPSYPNNPDYSQHIAAGDSRRAYPTDAREGYGARLSGFFVPQKTTNYTFYLRSDDASQLSLSTDSNPANLVVLTNETGCCGPFSTHASAPISLVAGQRYYMELLYKEGVGGDYGQVAFKYSGSPQDPNSLSPINGAFLASLADPMGASITITQQPLSQFFPVAATPVALLSENFNSGDGGFTVLTPQAYTAPWVYNGGSGSWIEDGQGPENGHANISALTSPMVTLTAAGNVVVSFSHRYSFEFDGTAWDGGQLRVSINGGPTNAVPGASFTQNGYNGTAVAIGSPSFTATSAGHGSNTKITSTADLGFYPAGTTIRIQFYAANDSNTRGATPNWEVDSVDIVQGSSPLNVQLTVGHSATNAYGDWNQAAFQWQRNVGGTWQNIIGGNSATYVTKPTPGLVTDYRCIVYIPGAGAISSTAQVVGLLSVPWSGGVLQWADQVTGPWTDVPGPVANPYLYDVRLGPMKFFKVRP